MKKQLFHTRPKASLVLIIVLSALAACHNFYKASNITGQSADKNSKSIDSLKTNNRYFILRVNDKSFYMTDLVLSEDRKSISCKLDTLPKEHQLHLRNGRRGVQQYNPPGDLPVLSEVHLYIRENKSPEYGPYILQLEKVQKIEVIEKDKQRTTQSYVLGGIGYTAGALLIAGVIIAATKSSCPFVSASNNDSFSLQGEIYGGAVYPQLARHDYMPLRMSPTQDGSLQVKISNELKEKQFTDIAELWVIRHSRNSNVLADEKGNLYEINTPEMATSADFAGTDVRTKLTANNDEQVLQFDDTSSTTNNLLLQFNKPADQQKAKLVLSIKNSYWFDYLYGELGKKFGGYYNRYQKKQLKKPADEIRKWVKEQEIPLTVSVKTNNGWEKITEITTIGPLATRSIVVPLDISNIRNEKLELKLSSGFMFWEIDYAAVDYSNNSSLALEKLHPFSAVDEKGNDITILLQKEDGAYLEQPVPGTVASMSYKPTLTKTEDESFSYILHSKGYYQAVREFSGKPDVAFLKKFTKAGAMGNFSISQYKLVRDANLAILSK